MCCAMNSSRRTAGQNKQVAVISRSDSGATPNSVMSEAEKAVKIRKDRFQSLTWRCPGNMGPIVNSNKLSCRKLSATTRKGLQLSPSTGRAVC